MFPTVILDSYNLQRRLWITFISLPLNSISLLKSLINSPPSIITTIPLIDQMHRTNMEGLDPNKFDSHHHQPPPRPAAAAITNRQSSPPPPRNCPRCDSSNTKFCYYNNYSLSQPRYFCKACRRYWTHGGTLRNIPIGGGSRKGPKRHRQSGSASSRNEIAAAARSSPSAIQNLATDSAIRVPPSIGNSFYSGGGLLASLGGGQYAPSNHAAAMGLGGNMALLQGMNLASMAARQYQVRNELFTSSQSLNSNYLSQGFLNRDTAAANPSAGGHGFWSGNVENQNSFSLAQWPDHKYHGFLPQ